jgi:hypothetical protein
MLMQTALPVVDVNKQDWQGSATRAALLEEFN